MDGPSLYDLARIRSSHMALGSIRDIAKDENGVLTYRLQTFSNGIVATNRADLEPLPVSESPFAYYEVVTIRPDLSESSLAESVQGERAVVDSIALDDDTGTWCYGVTRQNGEGWFFTCDELEHTGYMVPPAVIEGSNPKVIARIAVDRKTGEGRLISGDPNFKKRGPRPLSVDLSRLGLDRE